MKSLKFFNFIQIYRLIGISQEQGKIIGDVETPIMKEDLLKNGML